MSSCTNCHGSNVEHTSEFCPKNKMTAPIEDNELRERLQAELDEFVLFTDNSPDSNEPTELSVYLHQCGFDNVMNRLCDELMPVINAHTTRKEAQANLDGIYEAIGILAIDGLRITDKQRAALQPRIAELEQALNETKEEA